MNIWGITDVGLVRNENQDSFRAQQLDGQTALMVVCDGMGGARAGNVASRMAADAFVAEVCARRDERDLGTVLGEAVWEANDQVFSASLAHEEYRGMGTTLVAALVTPEKIWLANVGDSRGYLIGEDAICRVTRDHSFVEDLVLRGEITPEEARTHPQKNLITRALGVDRTVRVDVFERENRGGWLLLCSDGLSNMVTDEELRSEVVADDRETCCSRLLKRALDGGAPDNVTVVVAQL